MQKTVSVSCDKLDMNLDRESLREYQCMKVNIRGDVFYCFEENYPDYMNIDFALEELSRLDTLSLRQFWKGKIEGIIFDGCNEWVIQLLI